MWPHDVVIEPSEMDMVADGTVDMQDMRSKRKLKVPESAFKDGPQGLKCAQQCLSQCIGSRTCTAASLPHGGWLMPCMRVHGLLSTSSMCLRYHAVPVQVL